MASGLPGVSTDVGGVRDVITSSSVGEVVPFGDAEGLARSVLSLLSDNQPERRAMGMRARDAVSKRFTIERLVTEIVDLYAELMNEA
jgi:glycosyltransferase involved in cell wall biosynthesis